MSENEVRKLRKATEDKAIADMVKGRTTWVRIWMLIDLATKSGLRVAEIANLTVNDLSLGKEPCIHVVGKGNKKRIVYIDSKLKKHLKEYIKSHDMKNEDHLLKSSHGKPFTTRALQKHFKSALKVSGLSESYSIHSARHSYATVLYAQTKDLRLIQKQLGHSSVTTTSVYADCTKENIMQAVNDAF
jgi:site-specific recombinase XerD